MKQCPTCSRRYPTDLNFCPHDGVPLKTPTGRLETPSATSNLPRFPWENEDGHDRRVEQALEALKAAELDSGEPPLPETGPGPIDALPAYGGPPPNTPPGPYLWSPSPLNQPWENDRQPVKTIEDIPRVEPYLQPPPPTVIYGGPMPPPRNDQPQPAPVYGGPPPRRMDTAPFVRDTPGGQNLFHLVLPIGFFGIGLTLGAALGAALMLGAGGSSVFVGLNALVFGVLLGACVATIGWFLSRKG